MCHVKKCRREDENLCWKHVSLERQDVDASFLSTSNLPLSALPGFLDQAKLIFFRFRQHSTFKAIIAKWNRAIFVFTPRQTGRWVGSRALPVQNPPISALVVVGLRSTVKSGNSTLNGLGCHKSLRSVGLVVQQWLGELIIGWAPFGLNCAVLQPKLSAKHSEICFCFGSTLLHYCWCCYVILSASRSSRCWERGLDSIQAAPN